MPRIVTGYERVTSETLIIAAGLSPLLHITFYAVSHIR
jgi:hypothetical protein